MLYDGNKLILPEIFCGCGLNHSIPDMDIYIGSDILENISEYLGNKLSGRNILLVADNNTFSIAGQRVANYLKAADYNLNCCVITRPDEMDPDQTAVGEIVMTYDGTADFLLAVGSGSICDVTRYAAYCLGKPYAIVGTAPSMDGYTSINSALVFNGIKINKFTDAPKVIVCDIHIMKDAPYPMFISGFGDVLGKYIARADWTISKIINNELYCDVCIDLIMQALKKCLDCIEEIKNRTYEGTKSLIEALLLSGLTILIISNTRAVASNEHNMAHMWEMMKLSTQEAPPSHGTSVGVATLYCLKFFEEFIKAAIALKYESEVQSEVESEFTTQSKEADMRNTLGNKMTDSFLEKNPGFHVNAELVKKRIKMFFEKYETICNEIAFLPTLEKSKKLLEYLGSPLSAFELGISDERLMASLIYAKDFRNRYGIFNLAEELGLLNLIAVKSAVL